MAKTGVLLAENIQVEVLTKMKAASVQLICLLVMARQDGSISYYDLHIPTRWVPHQSVSKYFEKYARNNFFMVNPINFQQLVLFPNSQRVCFIENEKKL